MEKNIQFNQSLAFIRNQRAKLDDEYFADPIKFKQSIKALVDAWHAQRDPSKKHVAACA